MGVEWELELNLGVDGPKRDVNLRVQVRFPRGKNKHGTGGGN